MYRLTDIRLKKLRPLLEDCLDSLKNDGKFSTGHFEVEVRKILDTGYQEVKSLASQLAKSEDFERVGAYYMEYGHGAGPASEHKDQLAELYGLSQGYDYSPDLEEKRAAYWGAEN